MSTTYTQIYIQSIFSVQDRNCLISKTWKDELCKYISGIIKNNKHKPPAVNSAEDHIHVFAGMKPHQSVSDLLEDIKAYSSGRINDKKLVHGHFNWQTGYGAFSYSHLPLD